MSTPEVVVVSAARTAIGGYGGSLKDLGTTQKVLVDAPGIGRSSADAPEIDGVVKFKGGKQGEFLNIRIDRSDEHDLHGRMV